MHFHLHEEETGPRLLSRERLATFGVTLLLVALVWRVVDIERAAPPAHGQSMELPPAAGALPEVPAPKDAWEHVTVKPGQTLDAIFRQQGFDIGLLHRILALNGDTRGLTRIRPGDTFDFQRDADGGLAVMRYPVDEERYLLVRNSADSLTAETEQRQIVREVREAEGTITSSLFVAGKQAGLSDKMVMKLAGIFGWDIDFFLDIREGDRFVVVYEAVYRDGEFLREGEILAAGFVNQGQHFQAVRYGDGESAEYYAPDGRPMRKAFLRAPLDFSYISSNFNPRRMHPILKRVRPHNGTDYYAPKGTPVHASGDGTVIRSAYGAANGHHVFIRHTDGIETRYLHFTKRAVKQGQKVKQGQTIGYVGSTGLATGPHLHYEFVLNGVHRDPRTVPLPKIDPLGAEQLAGFQAHAAPLLTQLSRLEAASLYASGQ